VRVYDGGLAGLTAALVLGAVAYLPLLWTWRGQLHLTALASGLSIEESDNAGGPEHRGGRA
jgi:hypothetical protein